MAKIFDTRSLHERLNLSADHTSWIYNGLDCCVTAEVRERLLETLDKEPPFVRGIYDFGLDKLGPIMEMSLRGVRIDIDRRDSVIRAFSNDIARLEKNFNRICKESFGLTINWRSPVQVRKLLYDIMNLRPVKARNSKGVFAPTTGRKALEKLRTNFVALPIVNHLLAMRDLGKQLGFLKTNIDADGRFRAEFNAAGTNTGRLASSVSQFGTGSNLQNVHRRLRSIFIPDPGMIFVNIDLEQADARNVAGIIWDLFEDDDYLNACESGDLHTTVCRMAWKGLDWPQDRSGWRAVADQKAYREHTYRDLAKRLGHGTNYYGTPRTMAHELGAETAIIASFQKAYFAAFPGILRWHKWVKTQLNETACLITPFPLKRRRFFYGRPNDPSTIRKAIAYCPQGMTAMQIDLGMLQLWREFPTCHVLLQIHDSILLQVPYAEVNQLVPKLLEAILVHSVLRKGRAFCVPVEAKVGFNWGDVEYRDGKPFKNKIGLAKWTGRETRKPPLMIG